MIVQVIWSYVGWAGPPRSCDPVLTQLALRVFIIPATAQMTFKHYNPKTKKQVWKSVNSTGFKPNGQSCKSDQFVSCYNCTEPASILMRLNIGDQTLRRS